MDAVASRSRPKLDFLACGGELAERIRDFDWASTSIGPIESWSQPIKSTTALILRSPVPIVTLWGEKGVMIYNDAYAEFAGNRHPQLLGMDVLEAWPEAADWNRQVMDTAFHRGEALSVQDMVLELDRRGGGREPAWLNLDYSPVPDTDGTPVGVIAIVIETTGKVRAERLLSHEREQLRLMFEQAPGFMALLEGPDHVFTMANEAYFALVGGRELIGMKVADALPEVADQGFVDLLHSVYSSRQTHVGRSTAVRLHRADGREEERFVDFVYQPLLAENGTLTGIFVQGHDVTDHKRGEQLRNAHNRVLELAIQNAPLKETLEGLVETVEENSTSGMLASILLLDDDGKHLRHGAAPSLPDAYNAAIDGLDIGPSRGSCGTAAFTAKPVFVTEIASDPLWTDFRDLAAEHNLGACWSIPILSGSGKVLGTFAMYHREPREPTGQDLELVQVITRTAALIINRRRVEAALRESEQRYRRIFEQASDLIITSDLNQTITDCNPAAAEAVGLSRDEAIGRNISEFISPEDHARTADMLRSKLEGGGTTQYDVRVRSSTGEWLSWEINSGLTFDDAGNPVGLHVVARDVTERKRFERYQQLLVGELNHRVKNTLAIVQSLTHQSFHSSLPAEDAISRFEGRLEALAGAHNLLTHRNWEAASMHEVVSSALAPFCTGDRCRIEGPEVSVSPQTAVSLALALHELATNAAKYGALCGDGGRVSVSWSLVGEQLEFTWSESGGPPVKPPERRGFGTRMIERTLASEFGGKVELDFAPEGVTCRVVAPAPATA